MADVRKEILERVEKLNIWRRGGERAPHKPLLMLLALARLGRGETRLAEFRDLEEPLQRLLEQFGPPRKSIHPEYPFWRLQHDGLWEVPDQGVLPARALSGDPPKAELRKHRIKGGFPEPIYEVLRHDRRVREEVVRKLLEGHFPSSLHQDLLDELRLFLQSRKALRPREASFRLTVIQAYQHRCAVCNFDLKVRSTDLALEAAHIRWHQAGGPDEVQNGMALCAIHHKALDYGAIGLSDDLTLLVSSEMHGQNWAEQLFYAFAGRKVSKPIRSAWEPAIDCIRWHRREVFRTPARD